MSEYIPAMPPCQIQPFGTGDQIPVLLWKVTTSGVKPMIPAPQGGVQVYSGKYRVTRDYYSITEDNNS